MVSSDERRRDEIARLEAELSVEKQRRQRAAAELGPPRLRNRNRFFNGLLHGELNTLERAKALQEEIRRCDENIVRINNRLAALRDNVGIQSRELPGGDLDRRTLTAKVRREKKARSSADHLLAAIRKARNRLKQAGRHRVRDEASRSVVDQDAKELAGLLRAVRRSVDKLRTRTPSAVPANLDSADRLHLRFSGSAVDDDVRAKEYEDAIRVLDALAGEAGQVQKRLVFREAQAKHARRASSR